MNKSILAAAITAGLMVPGLAAADVKLSGAIQAETGNIDIETQGPGGDTDTTAMGDGGLSGATNGGGANAVGISGTEKLGNGLTAYFKINQQFETFGSAGHWAARDSFVGVKGDGWHVQFGEMNSRYKLAAVKYDPFLTTGLQARGVGAVSDGNNGYAEDMMEVGFSSGAWSGGAQVTWEDSTNSTGGALGDGNVVDAGSWNGNIKYAANNWEAGLGYQDLDYGTGGGDADMWVIHGKWSGNGFSVMASYEDVDANTTAAAAGATRPDGGGTLTGTGAGAPGASAEGYESFQISATYALSDSTSIIGRYNDTDWDDIGGAAGADADGDHWAIGVKHNLSKRTHVYGGYMDNDVDYSGAAPDMEVDAWAIGMLHKF